jgi:hypothetical protein
MLPTAKLKYSKSSVCKVLAFNEMVVEVGVMAEPFRKWDGCIPILGWICMEYRRLVCG